MATTFPLDSEAADRIGAALANYAEDVTPDAAAAEIIDLAQRFDELSDELELDRSRFALVLTIQVRA